MSFLAAASRHKDVLSVRSFSFPLCVKGLVFRVTADSVSCYDSVTVFRDTYKPFDQKRKKSRNHDYQRACAAGAATWHPLPAIDLPPKPTDAVRTSAPVESTSMDP